MVIFYAINCIILERIFQWEIRGEVQVRSSQFFWLARGFSHKKGLGAIFFGLAKGGPIEKPVH